MQGSGVRSQESGVRGQGPGARGQEAGWRAWLAQRIAPRAFAHAIATRVDDSPGWAPLGTLLDRDWAQLYQLQTDAVTAWRENPLARAIVSLQTSYVVGDGITLSSDYRPLRRFVEKFWDDPENRLALRLPELCDELTRAGELFPALHFAPDGMTYVRFVPASRIDRLEWRSGDYEHELRYHEITTGVEGAWWLSPRHPDARQADAVMLHYSVNKIVGCTRGESDLAPILIWLRRYSGWLEDRARLNWAARVFLWFVTVPSDKVIAKQAQYRQPPESGSVIVKDSAETWEMQTPNLQARDASTDGRQMRYMVAAGAGVPLHMLGEGENTNLATAQAMQEPTLRQFRRRQMYFCHMLKDIVVHAYNRHIETHDMARRRATHAMLKVIVPDMNRDDNGALATAGREIVQMLATLREQLRAAGVAPTADLNRKTVEMAFRFAGEVLTADEIMRLLGVAQERADAG